MSTEEVLRKHAPGEDWHCTCGEDLFGGSAAYSYELYLSHVSDALLSDGTWTREDRWIPVTESGQRWVPRSLEAAQESMRCYPVGGEYQEGDPWDGITHLEHEFRYVTEWEASA